MFAPQSIPRLLYAEAPRSIPSEDDFILGFFVHMIPASFKATLSDPRLFKCEVERDYQRNFKEWIDHGRPHPSQSPELNPYTYQCFLETEQASKEAAVRSAEIRTLDRFSMLPTELKMKIVGFCDLPPRILRVMYQPSRSNRPSPSQLPHAPPTAHVDRQLRDIFFRNWNRIEITMKTRESNALERKCLHLNYRIDTLIIDSTVIVDPSWATCIRFLVHMGHPDIRPSDIDSNWIMQKMSEPLDRLPEKLFTTFPSLKTFWAVAPRYCDEYFLTCWQRPNDELHNRRYTLINTKMGWTSTWPAFRYYVDSGNIESTILDYEEICDIWTECKQHNPSWRPYMACPDLVGRLSFVHGNDKPKDDGKIWQRLHPVDEDTDSLEAIRRRLAWGMVVENICAYHNIKGEGQP